MAIKISGLISGMDTDSMVQELVSAYAAKKDNYTKAQTKLEWKMDAWKSMNSQIYGFYTSSLSNMRLTSNYSMKTSSVSNTNAAKVTASTTAVNGTQSLKVKQLASTAYLTGGVVQSESGEKVTGSTKLADMGIEAGSKMSVNGYDFEVSADMTIDQLIGQLRTGGVTASFDENNQRFFISSSKSGSEGEFAITAANAGGLDALQTLGLFSTKDVNGNETIEMAKYRELVEKGDDGSEKYAIARAIVDAADSAAADLTAYNETISIFERASDVVAVYDAYASFASDYEEQQKIVDDYNADIATYRNKLVKETTTDAEGNPANVEYTDKEIADMKTYISENSESTDAEVQAKLADYNAIVEAKDITDKYDAAVAYTTDSDNIEAYAEAQSYVVDAANSEAYTALIEYVNDENHIADYNEAKRVVNAQNAVNTTTDAARISGQDSIIELNGANFTSSTGTFSINGLSITAMQVTGDEAVSITTATDTQGIYDKIKGFLSKYNELLTAMDTAYNADSSGNYEPLTDDEMEEMTDSQIEKWEQKIKDALLRRDSTLGNVSTSMKSLMQAGFEVNGVTYTLASFGINTLNYFSADANERGSLHIDGDSEDSATSGNTDKLMAAISADPEAVTSFFQQLSSNLYDNLTKQMASSSISSVYTIYNDKQMSSEYSDYSEKISTWEEKLEEYEEYYYQKFSAMETALSKLQSSSSALSGLLGSGS